jgi:hypothetical protein
MSIITSILTNTRFTYEHKEKKPRRWRVVSTNKKQTIPPTVGFSRFFVMEIWHGSCLNMRFAYLTNTYCAISLLNIWDLKAKYNYQTTGGGLIWLHNRQKAIKPTSSFVLWFILLYGIKHLDNWSKREGITFMIPDIVLKLLIDCIRILN